MDFLKELGALALSSRFRRLNERLAQDVITIYSEQNIPFHPRWFPVFILLSRHAPLSIMEVAGILGITHPCVNQIANDLIREGLVRPLKDKTDRRKRLLVLTEKGQAMLPALQKIWDTVETAAQQIMDETGMDVLAMLDRLDAALDRESLYQRYQVLDPEAVQVITFQPEYREAFKALNLEWIREYFTVEPEDERILSNPEAEILAKGGQIFFALLMNPDSGQREPVGTCALVKKGDGIYELSKMGVTAWARGKHIGKKLLEAAVAQARDWNAAFVLLETNSKLGPAIHLYEKAGFVEIPFDEASKYARTDKRMRLML